MSTLPDDATPPITRAHSLITHRYGDYRDAYEGVKEGDDLYIDPYTNMPLDNPWKKPVDHGPFERPGLSPEAPVNVASAELTGQKWGKGFLGPVKKERAVKKGFLSGASKSSPKSPKGRRPSGGSDDSSDEDLKASAQPEPPRLCSTHHPDAHPDAHLNLMPTP